MSEICNEIARAGAVEILIQRITHLPSLTPDLQDLAQTVYVALLSTSEERLVDLWENPPQINYYIVRVIENQMKNGQWAKSLRRWGRECVSIDKIIARDDAGV